MWFREHLELGKKIETEEEAIRQRLNFQRQLPPYEADERLERLQIWYEETLWITAASYSWFEGRQHTLPLWHRLAYELQKLDVIMTGPENWGVRGTKFETLTAKIQECTINAAEMEGSYQPPIGTGGNTAEEEAYIARRRQEIITAARRMEHQNEESFSTLMTTVDQCLM